MGVPSRTRIQCIHLVPSRMPARCKERGRKSLSSRGPAVRKGPCLADSLCVVLRPKSLVLCCCLEAGLASPLCSTCMLRRSDRRTQACANSERCQRVALPDAAHVLRESTICLAHLRNLLPCVAQLSQYGHSFGPILHHVERHTRHACAPDASNASTGLHSYQHAQSWGAHRVY